MAKMLGWFRRCSKYAIAMRAKMNKSIAFGESISGIKVVESSISRNLGFKFGQHRYYNSNNRNRNRNKWIERGLVVGGMVGSSAFIFGVYNGAIEQRILPSPILNPLMELSIWLEKRVGEFRCRRLMHRRIAFIRDDEEPSTVRVAKISKDILGALERALTTDDETFWALAAEADNNGKKKWLNRNRIQDQFHQMNPNWEVSVMRWSYYYVLCFPHGKIVLSSAVLNFFRTDAEIAAIIGRQVWLELVHRTAEEIAAVICCGLFYLGLIALYQIPALALSFPSLAMAMLPANFLIPWFIIYPGWRLPKEANNIGAWLMASAGYVPNPKKAPPKTFLMYDSLQLEGVR